MEFDRKKYKFLCYTLTSSRGMMCCLLYFFLLMMILPQTRISLNKKNCLGLGSFLHPLVKTPSPTKTRLGAVRGCPAPPKQLSAMAIRLALASLLTEILKTGLLNYFFYIFFLKSFKSILRYTNFKLKSGDLISMINMQQQK